MSSITKAISKKFKIATSCICGLVVAAAITSPAQAADQGKQVFAGSTILHSSMSADFSNNSKVFARSTTSPRVHRVVFTKAQPGEGVIRMVTRVCEDANNWQSVAADNKIGPPVYLVRLGQELAVDCGSETPPAVVPQAAAAPAAAQPQVYTASGSGWVRPVGGVCLISGFRTASRPTHDGVDLDADFGAPIRAAAAGEVSVGWQAGGAGNYSMINHGGGLWTVYMHQSSFQVTSGWVNAGDVIGYVGSTGNSEGPHLHFEVHTGGLWNEGGKVDPMWWMSDHGAALGC